MDDVKQQVVDRLKQANNILVTVRTNPTVDLLSACIGLALVLDKAEHHATAVFSGEVPSAMEFLKPEETIEKTPNSLRDFIIALDKSKADKLRYKVEDNVVRIFITPFKTSITQDDLEFSQGDFNIDVIIALGAHEQQELDQAVTAHGRILHDATVISINNTPNGNLGALNWQDPGASSISEMVAQLTESLGNDLLDSQVATALLTGIVAETNRFSNDKTTPKTMSVAGKLMAAGANQQLVANKLDEGHALGATAPSDGNAQEPKPSDNGTLNIDHPEEETAAKPEEMPAEEQAPAPAGREMLPMPEPPQISGVHGAPLGESPFSEPYQDEEVPAAERSFLVDSPSAPHLEPKHDEAPQAPVAPGPFDVPAVIQPEPPAAELPAPAPAEPVMPPEPAPAAMTPNDSQPAGQTLEEIEASVHSPHVEQPAEREAAPQETPKEENTDKVPGIIDEDYARMQVANALNSPEAQAFQRLEPIQALNANPLGDALHPRDDSTPAPAAPSSAIEVDAEGNLKPLTPPGDTAQPAAGQDMQMPQPFDVSRGMPPADQGPDNPGMPALDMQLPPVMGQPPAGPQPDQNAEKSGGTPPPPVPPPFTPGIYGQ